MDKNLEKRLEVLEKKNDALEKEFKEFKKKYDLLNKQYNAFEKFFASKRKIFENGDDPNNPGGKKKSKNIFVQMGSKKGPYREMPETQVKCLAALAIEDKTPRTRRAIARKGKTEETVTKVRKRK